MNLFSFLFPFLMQSRVGQVLDDSTDGRRTAFLSCIYTFFTGRTLGAVSSSSARHGTPLHTMMSVR